MLSDNTKMNAMKLSLPLGSVIPVAIAAVYLSKQGVSDLGYTRARVSFRAV